MQLKCPCLYKMLTGGSELRVRFERFVPGVFLPFAL